jgi:hypothetical protein
MADFDGAEDFLEKLREGTIFTGRSKFRLMAERWLGHTIRRS